ncbi:UNVERIFIED_CONTAM: Pentatricopeptide repeat-containing protein [Sesamum latifolium]|uniref:Pentatricopeptide repeat-containing protein n=1 Tax=Sesamum latifolium TaxID=2727402 RepID=A0AAW2VYK8_9LAMI
MQKKTFPIDRFSFPPLLKAASKAMALSEGKMIHGLAAKLGFDSDPFVETALVGMYAACGLISEARLVFDKMSYKDVVSWTIMIDGRHGHGSLYDKLKPRNVVASTAMISGYSKVGNVEAARLVFDEMVDKDLVCWSAMISGYADSDKPQEALKIFHEMQRHGIKPDQVTMLSVISACAHLGALDQAKQIHLFVDDNGFGKAMPINNALIDIMISAFAIHGDVDNALKHFQQMKLENVEPNWITFVGVLYACSHAGLVEEGQKAFETMVNEYGITPRLEHYGCMVDLYGRANRLADALELVESMPMAPNVVIWGSLMAACRIHGEFELGEFAAKRLLELDPDHDGPISSYQTSMQKRKDKNHKQTDEIYAKLDEVVDKLKQAGYTPNTSSVLVDLDEDEKKEVVLWHSEKLALCYGLISREKQLCIRVIKNLRICEDCHNFMKKASKVFNVEIIVRDRTRFHHCRDGSCSCKDYW